MKISHFLVKVGDDLVRGGLSTESGIVNVT